MKQYLKYFAYIVKHKWYVMKECFKYGLYLQGIAHDWSKFALSEFIPYANFFYGAERRDSGDSTGYYKPTNTGDKKFDYAWLLHQKRNRHHWQWWTLAEDEGRLILFEIPRKYWMEMVCDWNGAGMAQGKGNSAKIWYTKNRHKILLHPSTRENIENFLNYEKPVFERIL